MVLDPPKLAPTLSSIFHTKHSVLSFSAFVQQPKTSSAVFSIASNTAFNPRMFHNNVDMLAPSRYNECFIHKSLSHSRSGEKCLKLSSSGGDNTRGIDDATVADA